MKPGLLETFVQRGITASDGTSLAAGHVFRRVERKYGGIGPRARALTITGAFEAVRAVLYNPHIRTIPQQLPDSPHVAHLPVKMHRNNRLRPRREGRSDRSRRHQ